MKLIGLTGGIGSGKTMVAEILQSMGIPVYSSDDHGKRIMNTDTVVIQKITDLFGTEAYNHGNLNSAWIASKVFQDKSLLQQLNAIVHPAVYDDLIHWTQKEECQSAPYIIQESAIFFEENLTQRFNAVILVVADVETRIERVMKRDQADREKVISRMQQQWPDEKKIPLADFIIYNDGSRSVIRQIIDIHMMIRKLY